jgi:hypothetical protein
MEDSKQTWCQRLLNAFENFQSQLQKFYSFSNVILALASFLIRFCKHCVRCGDIGELKK